MVVGQLEIQLMASMARLQSDMDKAKSTVSDAVGKMNQVLGAIGAGISVAGFANLIKSTADAADKMRDLKIISGLAIEQLGGLGKAAAMNGSNIDQVARAVGVMSKNMYAGSDAFNVIGVQIKNANGTLRDAGQVMLDIADKFLRMEDGATKSAIANEIFGKSGRDLIPTLNQGRGELEQLINSYAKHSGMTNKLADDSDKFNDVLFLLGERVTGVKNTFVGELLPTLINIGNAMLSAGDSTDRFSFAASVVVPVLKGLAIAAFTVVDTFRGMGREIGARAAQLSALANMDFSGAKFIGQALAEDNIKSRAEYDKFVETILNGESKIERAVNNGGTKEMLKLQEIMPQKIGAVTKAKEKEAKAYDIELYKLKQFESEAKRARDITDSVATKQERYNQTLEELERLKPYLSVDTYSRALEKAQKELQGTADVNRSVVSEMDQLWVQAGRNIQSTLSNSVFDFFTGGLDSMVSNVKNAVLRIISEFAGLKIAQSVGLSALFAIPGSAAAQTSAGGIGGTGALTAINAASLGTTALNFAKGGFGFNALAGGALSFLGGSSSIGAFGSGLAGGSIPGISSQAALFGSQVAAVSGPLIAAFAATQGFKALAGDKRLGGGFGNALNTIGDIPIIGDLIPIIPIINGLFGRGPLKQKSTTLSGTIGAEGFTAGALQTDFVAKGGLFRSNKNDFARVDAVTGAVTTDNRKLQDYADQLAKSSREIIGLINETTVNASKGLRQVAGDLNLSTTALDSFNHQINLVSEKGKSITQEQVAAEIEKISDSLARSLIPSIDSLAKSGESALQAVSRLGQEFNALVAAGTNIGASIASSRQFILGASFDQRTAFVEAAGGIDALLQKTQIFAEQFLTEEQRLAPVQERLNEELSKLGLSTDITRDQFAQLVQSFGSVNGISEEMFHSLLNVAQAFDIVRDASEAVAKAEQERLKAEQERLAALKQRDIEERRRFAQELGAAQNKRYEEERQKTINSMLRYADGALAAVNSHLSKLKSLSEAIRSATQSISPQSIEEARANILSALNFDKKGNVRGIGNINKIDSRSIGTLANQSTAGFTSTFDFELSKARNLSILQTLNSATEKSIIAARETAMMIQSERNNIPKYATGTSYVPKTGPAIVHRGERIIPADKNDDLKKSTGNDQVIAAINKLVQKFDDVLQGGDALRVKTV